MHAIDYALMSIETYNAGPLNAEVLARFLYVVKLDKALRPLPINDDWVVMLSLMSYYSNLEREQS